MKSYRIVYALCACLLALALASCATNATSYNTSGEWQQPRTEGAPFRTVLVFANVPDAQMRRAFELSVARAITNGGARGIAAHPPGGQAATLTKDKVVTIAQNSGAEVVLVIRVVERAAQVGTSREEAYVHVGPTTKVVQNEDASFTRALTTNYAIEVVPGTMVIKADAVLESSVYEVAGETLVYRATTRGRFEFGAEHGVEDVAYRFANSIAGRLRSDKVVR